MKHRIPSSVANVFQNLRTPQEKQELIKNYKSWQDSQFSQAHYDYLCKEYDRLLNEYINASWTTKFLRKEFLTENKAKLQLIKKLKDTFKCEEL